MYDVPAETVAAILDHALAQPARLGGGRLVCVDGPSGSGKTTIAAALATAAAARGVVGVHVLHTDDLLDGWTGLPALGARLRDAVVLPLADGQVGRYRRYDWATDGFAEEHLLAPTDLLVLDGVGSGDPLLAGHRAALVWVEADDDELRLARGVARDGEAVREPLRAWMAAEADLFRRHATRERADVRVDEVGRLLP